MAKCIENMDKAQLLAEISRQEKNLADMDKETPERRTCEYSLRRLRKAVSFVGDSGLTFRQMLERRIGEVEITRKWERDSMDGQYGRITVYKSGDFQIRSVGRTFFVYEGHEMKGMLDKLFKAKAFVEFLDDKRPA